MKYVQGPVASLETLPRDPDRIPFGTLIEPHVALCFLCPLVNFFQNSLQNPLLTIEPLLEPFQKTLLEPLIETFLETLEKTQQ